MELSYGCQGVWGKSVRVNSVKEREREGRGTRPQARGYPLISSVKASPLRASRSPTAPPVAWQHVRPDDLKLLFQLRTRQQSLIKEPGEPFWVSGFHQLIQPFHHLAHRTRIEVASPYHTLYGPLPHRQGRGRALTLIFSEAEGPPDPKAPPE